MNVIVHLVLQVSVQFGSFSDFSKAVYDWFRFRADFVELIDGGLVE